MLERLRTYASFVRFSHSVFALPFALTGALLATTSTTITLARVGWIVAAMVSARTAAMGFNRLVDARFDALNPRTKTRELPRGTMSRAEALVLVVASSLMFRGRVYPARAAMSGVVTRGAGDRLLVLAGQALHGVHSTLSWPRDGGCSRGWVARGGRVVVGGSRGSSDWRLAPGLLGSIFCTRVRISTSNRLHGLHSIPVRFGVATSLRMSRALHVVTVVALAALAVVLPLGLLYLAGLGGVASFLHTNNPSCARTTSRASRRPSIHGYVGIFYLVVTALALYVN